MFEQEDAAAGGGFADGKHGIELLHFDLFLHFVAVASAMRSRSNTQSFRP